MRPSRRAARLVGAALALILAGCTDQPAVPPSAPTLNGSTPSASPPQQSPATTPTRSPEARSSPRPSPRPSARLPRFDPSRAVRDIERLAEDIGPREATSRNFAAAADLVADRFSDLGYEVRRTDVRVPAGDSWGTPVRRGTSQNVIAEPRGFDPTEEHIVLGAHLDTVAGAPGAEDNASGVAVLLELARLASREQPEIPVQLVAFGAEEPRGQGDALHHFGSQQLVADLPRAERRSIVAMVSLDRVGVPAPYVPVCQAGPAGTRLRDALRDAGRHAGIRTRSCQNRASDHWSYEKAGVPAARIGSVPYAGYHSPGDVVSVVNRRQVGRVGRLMWSWLTGLKEGEPR